MDRVAAVAARIDALAKATKHAGSSRPIDHLRAKLFLGMTDGSYTGLDAIIIIIALLLATSDDSDTCDSCDADSDAADGGAVDPAAEVDAGSGDAGSAVEVSGRSRGGIKLRVRISTLLGRDRYPGESAGWGPVYAELAGDLAGRLARGEWRFAVTDPRGHLVLAGLTRARPPGHPRHRPQP